MSDLGILILKLSIKIPVWKQRAGDPGEDGLVFWDYHVILVNQQNDNCFVYDFDSTLDFPCSFDEYVSLAIRSDDDLHEEHRRMFRIIKAESFLANFSSDRSHMKKTDGSWMMPPPTYPCIKSCLSANNLVLYISMEQDNDLYGVVINAGEFCNKKFEI